MKPRTIAELTAFLQIGSEADEMLNDVGLLIKHLLERVVALEAEVDDLRTLVPPVEDIPQ